MGDTASARISHKGFRDGWWAAKAGWRRDLFWGASWAYSWYSLIWKSFLAQGAGHLCDQCWLWRQDRCFAGIFCGCSEQDALGSAWSHGRWGYCCSCWCCQTQHGAYGFHWQAAKARRRCHCQELFERTGVGYPQSYRKHLSGFCRTSGEESAADVYERLGGKAGRFFAVVRAQYP